MLCTCTYLFLFLSFDYFIRYYSPFSSRCNTFSRINSYAITLEPEYLRGAQCVGKERTNESEKSRSKARTERIGSGGKGKEVVGKDTCLNVSISIVIGSSG